LLTPFFEKFPSWFLLWATAPALATVSGFILMNVLSEIDFKNNSTTVILLLTTLPGVLGANLLLAFVVLMAAVAGYEYLTKGKASMGSVVMTVLGLIVLALYHY
jgi:AGZA family xanthine/uracil permease-like MFS transporter